MFLVLWEFEVKPGCEQRFELIYGPAGDWARLFRRDPEYHHTLLYRDPFRPSIYITLDFRCTRTGYDTFKQLNSTDYENLDKACEELMQSEHHLGSYDAAAP
jgi:hypothetical protein